MRRIGRLLVCFVLILTVLGAAAETAPAPTPVPAAGYVMVQWNGGSGWLPLAAPGEEYVYPLTQLLPDGTLAVNRIHVTDSGVYMEASTCANQDCVEEGFLCFENREERALGNMILCLPNQVLLQLYTAEEVLAMYAQGGE